METRGEEAKAHVYLIALGTCEGGVKHRQPLSKAQTHRMTYSAASKKCTFEGRNRTPLFMNRVSWSAPYRRVRRHRGQKTVSHPVGEPFLTYCPATV